MASVNFKISSALKTIIGKELITDDFIAVFELVKNSFDARARRVDITFESPATKKAKIVIQDNGHGMTKDDITQKWLFVAYSEKKLRKDYRDNIDSGRIYAGAKGIGRFSCDRLGEKLRLYTRTSKKDLWNVLDIDWGSFEKDAESEFQSIPAQYSTLASIPYSQGHGTILEISPLRNLDWNREKLVRLRRSLERLVNPNQENDANNFEIVLHCEDESAGDLRIKEEARRANRDLEAWKLVNGPVRNFVFENLGFKTAQIQVDVSADGETIRTELTDRGRMVYQLVEKSPYLEALANTRIRLFALNQSAKHAFTRRMGVRIHDYGSVFLYKNGFRIHPFGDPADDKLGIDKRHQQGVFRTLGTRDLSGRIEINGSHPEFQETSSRDGGLIQNAAFFDLKDLLIEFALSRLETFAIDIARFGTERGELPDEATMSKAQVKQAIFDIIAKLTRSKDVVEVKYDPDFLNILQNRSEESVAALLGNLKRLAAQQKSSVMAKEVAKAEKQLARLAKAKAEAEAGEAREREKAKRAEEEAREAEAKAVKAEEAARQAAAEAQRAQHREKHLDTQNVFLKSVLSKDLEHVISLHHSIGQDALTIEEYVVNLLNSLRAGEELRPEQLKVSLERISMVAKKIGAISRFATRANSIAAQEETTSDLVEYVREYLLNVYGGVIFDRNNNKIPILFNQSAGTRFVTRFAPIDISIIVDNLLSNSRKHHTSEIVVSIVEASDTQLVLSFADNGSGIPKRNLPHLFEIGFTTTNGSGLGLHHVKEVMTEMGGTVAANLNNKTGAEFLLTFTKR